MPIVTIYTIRIVHGTGTRVKVSDGNEPGSAMRLKVTLVPGNNASDTMAGFNPHIPRRRRKVSLRCIQLIDNRADFHVPEVTSTEDVRCPKRRYSRSR